MHALEQGKEGAGKQAKSLSVIENGLPVNSMEFVTPEGSTEAAIVCNTVTAVNRQSRRIGMGCPIRGDNPIPPPCGNWFTSSWGIDGLNQGAMNVLSGNMDQQLQSLIYMNQGRDTIAGYTVPQEKLQSSLAATVPGATQLSQVAQVPITATTFA